MTPGLTDGDNYVTVRVEADGVNNAARVEAEVRAEELRAEPARIQAVLDSHRLP